MLALTGPVFSIIIIFLHGLGQFDLFRHRRVAIVSEGVRDLFVVEGVFRKSGFVHSFKMVDPVLSYLNFTSCIPEIFSSFL